MPTFSKLNSFTGTMLVTDYDYKLMFFSCGILWHILPSLYYIATVFSGKPCKEFVHWKPYYSLFLILNFIQLSPYSTF